MRRRSCASCILSELRMKGSASRMGVVILLTASVVGTPTLSAFGSGPPKPDPSTVADQVKKFGVGKAVKVKLADGEKLSGHIQSIATDSFTVKLAKTGLDRPVPYDQVAEVKDPGPLTWMLVGAALVIVIILVARR